MSGSGLVHVYTGDGKGKTTAAIGLAIRAAGQGLTVAIIQFMKPEDFTTGEANIIKSIPSIELSRFAGNFIWDKSDFEEKKSSQESGLKKAAEFAKDSDFDMLILDEVITAVDSGLLEQSDLIDLIKYKDPDLELILTGRSASPELVALADYVTEMLDVKHPYDEGIGARRGIEF